MSDSSPVAPEVVRKVAALARLRLPEAELPAWTEQLGRILSYISQLERAVESGGGAERSAGSDGSEPVLAPTPLRPDSPVAGGGAEALAVNAPDLVHGYGSVPRVVGSSGSSGSSGSTA
jgi:aspartyl-tRNA(Asn)/glutamyl-tRNA(Gln) amidotransferase subunit C